MVFQDFLSFLVFLETSEVAGPGPNPREIEISFGADGPLACVRGPWARQEHLSSAALRQLSGIDCQSVTSSKLLGDTALCSGKPEDITNSKLAALARALDYFYRITRRRLPRTHLRGALKRPTRRALARRRTGPSSLSAL